MGGNLKLFKDRCPCLPKVCSHILKCGGTKIWRDLILDSRFKNINSEISIQRMVG
jgi:hypothetical protein